MFKLTQLITFYSDVSADDRQSVVAALEAATRANPNVRRAYVQPTLPQSYDGGDLLWQVQFDDERTYRTCTQQPGWREVKRTLNSELIANVDSAAYQQGWNSSPEPQIKNGFFRVLFMKLRPGVSPEKVALMEKEQCEMARYLPLIRNWQFSRVAESSGVRRWDYVWEQEFQDYAAWSMPYMVHPYHFAHLHRWFDAESPDWIQDSRFALGLCEFENSLLAPTT